MNFILKKWRFFLDCFSSSNGKLALKKNAIVDYLDYQISSGRFRSQKILYGVGNASFCLLHILRRI